MELRATDRIPLTIHPTAWQCPPLHNSSTRYCSANRGRCGEGLPTAGRPSGADNFGMRISLKRLLLRHGNTIAIALIPIVYLAINPSFGQNQAGDIDTWFYFGLAKSFWHNLGPDFHNDYYETRLPYIIPAAVIFAIPSDRIAALTLSYVVYCACAFSLFYVLRRQVSKPTALLTTIIMASDIFFMRTVGWQYVDSGLLAYGSLTFTALTAASVSRYSYAFVVLSGFFYASMVIVHLGFAPLGLAVAGYAIYILDVKRKTWRDFVALVLCAGVGAVSCQVIYGLLNIYLYRTAFFFEDQQIAAARLDAAFFEPVDVLLATGWWLTLHIAVWAAAGAMIIAKVTKIYAPNRFQSYCMLAVFTTYSILFCLDYFRVSFFLGKDGVHTSFCLFLSYLFIGSMLPNTIRMWNALIMGGLFLTSLILRFKLGAELARELPTMLSWAVGVGLGLLLVAVWFIKNRVRLTFVVLTALALTLPVNWPFRYERAIYTARDAIAKVVGDRLPYFAFGEHDPIYGPVIAGLISSFTTRAWLVRCRNFPDCPQLIIGQHAMVVVTSNLDSALVSSAVSLAVPEATPINADRFDWSNGKFSLYSFIVPESPVLLIQGSKLPSLVGRSDGSARVAAEGMNAGYLTFGPYATLNPGNYQVTMKYESEGETGSWDIVTSVGVAAKGGIPDSHGMVADITVTLDLPNGTQLFETRTLYSGHGRLSILSLEIRQLASSPGAK